MKLIPSKAQWQKWTLPSKVGYLAFIIGLLSIVLWGIGVMIQLQFGATKKSQEKIIRGQLEIKGDESLLLEGQKEIKTILLHQMKRINEERHRELIAKYPLGYVLFGIDHKEIIIPYKSQIENQFDINWNPAQVKEVTSEIVRLTLPDIYWARQNATIRNYTFGFSRKVGFPKSALLMAGIEVITEILSDDKKGIVILIGFKNK